jgi:hypothetical protein
VQASVRERREIRSVQIGCFHPVNDHGDESGQDNQDKEEDSLAVYHHENIIDQLSESQKLPVSFYLILL